MLATSLSRDLFQAVLRPKATDAELLRVGRLAAALGGGLGVLLALVLPSVASALKLFYGVMTAALFMPLVFGLLSRRPGAAHARVAIAAAILTTGGLLAFLKGTPHGEWLPSVAGVGLAGLVFATAWLRGERERPGGSTPAGPGRND
jgi:SSS family solute:Na+ symporter